MSEVFEAVVPDHVWVTERPVWFGGVRLRARTTVVRLAGGALWVHSPCAPTAAVCDALDALGEVRWIVVPNRYHHLHASATSARYPNARVAGPASATARNAEVRPALTLDAPAYIEATRELAPIPLDGVPFLDETVFFHEASSTLIAADLLICACARDHWSWRLAARITGRWEKLRTPPDVRLKTKPSDAVAGSVARIGALPIEQILVAHADPIRDRPKQQLAEAWQFAIPMSRR